LEHYAEFRRHLQSRYRIVVQEEETCCIVALNSTQPDSVSKTKGATPARCEVGMSSTAPPAVLDERTKEELLALFDLDYYSGQAGTFPSVDAALTDYLENGFAKGYSPNRLFNPAYYVSQYLHAASAGQNPLVHFLTHSVSGFENPNPYFDTELYYSQSSSLRSDRINALVHYVTHVSEGRANRHNPLFSDAYYLEKSPDVKDAGLNPFAHFITHGCAEGRPASHVHKSILHSLVEVSKKRLFRGNWRAGAVLLFSQGESQAETRKVLKIAEALEREYHVTGMVILASRTGFRSEEFPDATVAVLADFVVACDIFRPSALRLLVRSLAEIKPAFAIATIPGVVGMLHAEGVPSLFLAGEGVGSHSKPDLEAAFAGAARAVFESSADFHAAAKRLECYPTRVALRPYSENSVSSYVASLMALCKRDSQLAQSACLLEQVRASRETKKIYIPCCDWALSGVNSALNAIGKEVINLGWEVEILFTRDPAALPQAETGDLHLPEIPYRYLEPRTHGIEATWATLIAYLERNAPCIMLMAYDFAANSIAPALTDKVGVVAWVQSDDNDYYEQAYRLGRYCNAVVCVSDHIRKGIIELNPVIGAKARVIHNSSVLESEIGRNKARRTKRMRLIYTGRLVHYQKRILDVLDLAAGLDRLGVPYEITLAGEFSARENTEEIFKSKARAHLADGRIKLLGRMKRNKILDELTRNDFFLLLSDFEGMPLSLIEAMARGCIPVVAAMDSGIPEVITSGEDGLIVSGRDYDQWAALLADLWRNPERVSLMSQKGRETVRERFTVEHVGKQFDELFGLVAEEIRTGAHKRPPCLNWGEKRSPTGDVLLPSSMYRPPPCRPSGSPLRLRLAIQTGDKKGITK
jgi:glycosyltransferase involved in cell wall biosynthesis